MAKVNYISVAKKAAAIQIGELKKINKSTLTRKKPS